MKIIRIILGVFLSAMLILPSYAAVVYVKFTAYPSSPQTVQVGGQTSFQYTVQNTLGSALQIGAYNFTTNSDYTVESIVSPDCGGSTTTVGSIPAYGTCTITVTLQGNTPGTVTNPKLTVYYGEDMPVTAYNPLTINVSNAVATTYSVTPTALTKKQSVVKTGSTTTVSYTIGNDLTSGGALAVTGISAIPTNVTAMTVTGINSNCGGTNPDGSGFSLSPGATCNYSATVSGVAQGQGTIGLTVTATNASPDQAPPVESSTIYVGTPPTVTYSVSPSQFTSKELIIRSSEGTSPILKYTITNDSTSGGVLAANNVTLGTTVPNLLTPTYNSSGSSCTEANSVISTDGTSFKIQPGDSCTYAVAVAPVNDAQGKSAVTLSFKSNGTADSGSSMTSQDFYITNKGVNFSIQSLSHSPSSPQVGSPVSAYFLITNLEPKEGGGNLIISSISWCIPQNPPNEGPCTPNTGYGVFPTDSSVYIDSTQNYEGYSPCSIGSQASPSLSAGSSCVITVVGTPTKPTAVAGLGTTINTKNGWYNNGDRGTAVESWTAFSIYPSKRVPPATWRLTSSPTGLVSMKVGDTTAQKLVYTIQNTMSSTAKTPLLLQASDFVVQVNPQGLVNTGTATLNCPTVNKTKGSGVMPGQSCTYTLPVTPGTTTGKGTLAVTISPRNSASDPVSVVVPVAIAPGGATKESAVGFGTPPKPLFFKSGDTTPQKLAYQIENISTTGVLLLDLADFSASVTPAGLASVDATRAATLECPQFTPSGAGGKGLMPGGSCTYILWVKPGTTQGSGSVTLTVAPKNASPAPAPAVNIGVGPVTETAPWAFGKPPNTIRVQAGGSSKNLVFTIKNMSTTITPLLLSSDDLSAESSDSSSLTVGTPTLSTTNCLLKSITYGGNTVNALMPNQSCDIDVSVTAVSTATVMKGGVRLKVTPQNGEPPKTGNTQSADVAILPSATVLTAPYQVHSQGVSPSSPRVGDTVSATFEIYNNSPTVPLEITELVPYTNNSAVFPKLTIQGASTGGCVMPSSRKNGNTSSFLPPKTGSCAVVVSGKANQKSTNVELGFTIGTRNGDWGGRPSNTTYTNITIKLVNVPTATWSFGTPPAKAMLTTTSPTTTLTYQVNNSSTVPLTLTSGGVTTTNTFGAGVATVGAPQLGTCSNQGKKGTNKYGTAGVIPAQGSCNFTVLVTAGTKNGQGKVTLTVKPLNGVEDAQTSAPLLVAVTKGTLTPTWSLMPQTPWSSSAPNPITAKTNVVVWFTVTNIGKEPLILGKATPSSSNSKVLLLANPPFSTPSDGVDCRSVTASNTLKSTQSCNYAVSMFGGEPGTAQVTLDVRATGAPPHGSSHSSDITVLKPTLPTATWSFGKAPAAVTLTPGSPSTTLMYTIENKSTTTPLVLNASSFKVSTTPGLSVTVGTAQWVCTGKTKTGANAAAGTVPANTSCNYNVPVTLAKPTSKTGLVATGVVTLSVSPLNGPVSNGVTTQTQDSSAITVGGTVPTATWSFGTPPELILTAGNSTSQDLQYPIQNGSTTMPLLFNANSFSFTTTLASGVASVGTSGTLSCPPPTDTNSSLSNSLKGRTDITGYVLPSSTCNYLIPITAGSTAGSGEVVLTVIPVNSGNDTNQPNSQSGTVTVNSASTNNVTLPLVFIAQPAGLQVISSVTTLDLVYQIRNPNSDAATINSFSFTLPKDKSGAIWKQGTMVVQGSNCSATSIPGNTTCTYIFPLATPSSINKTTAPKTADYFTGIATGQTLSVSYSGKTQSGTLTSTPVAIDVQAFPGPSQLAISEMPSSPVATTTNSNLNLKYTLYNGGYNAGNKPSGGSSTNVTLYSESFPNSSFFSDMPAVTPSSSACTNYGGGGVLSPGACTFDVVIPVGSKIGEARSKIGFTVPYAIAPVGGAAAPAPITLTSQPMAIQVLSDGAPALAFITQPTKTNFSIAANSTAIGSVAYTVQNLTNLPVTLKDVSFTQSPLYRAAPTLSISGTGCSSTLIPAAGQCTYTVGISSIIPLGSQYATVTTVLQVMMGQSLTLSYTNPTTSTAGLLISNPLTIQVTPMQTNPSSTYLVADVPVVQKSIPINMMQTLSYGIANNTGSTLSIYYPDKSGVTLAANSGSGLLTLDDVVSSIASSCVNISSGNGCYISLSIAALKPGTFKGTLDITGITPLIPIEFEAYAPTDSRTLTFKNNCTANNTSNLPDANLWIALAPASVVNLKNISGSTGTFCQTSDDCPDGASCIVFQPSTRPSNAKGSLTTSNKQCYWNTPLMSGISSENTSYELAPGAQATVQVPYMAGQNPTLWGNFFNTAIAAKAGCSATSNCVVGDCSNPATSRQTPPAFDPTSYCPPAASIASTTTIGEMNFFLGNLGTTVDSYDISNINGITVPLSITPSQAVNSNPYICGSPGSALTVNSLGACSWKFDWSQQTSLGASQSIPSIYFTNVVPNANSVTTACQTNVQCQTGSSNENQVCGIDYLALQQAMLPDNSAGVQIQPVCGVFTGYITPDSVCSANVKAYSWSNGVAINYLGNTYPFYCSGNGPANTGMTFSDLFSCSNTGGSCYSQGAKTNCCGCQNWSALSIGGVAIGVPSDTSIVPNCISSNPDWLGTGISLGSSGSVGSAGFGPNIVAILGVMKNACPSAYTFPYDDPSSSFVCGANGNTPSQSVNKTNYTITFCPGGGALQAPSDSKANLVGAVRNARASGNIPAGAGNGRVSSAVSNARASDNLPEGRGNGRVADAVSNANPDAVLSPGSN